MVSVDDIIMKPRQTLDQVYERVHGCQNALEQSKEALIQANKRIGEKAKECNTLKAEIERLKEELEKKEDKIRLLGYIRLMKRYLRPGRLDTEEGKAAMDYYKGRLLEYLDKVSDLDL